MHNRLIFLYHHVRANSYGKAVGGCSSERTWHVSRMESDGGTQEGRSTGRWLSRSKHVGGPIGKSVGHILRDVMPNRFR